MNEKICGTYWLVATADGSKLVTQGVKPQRIGDCWMIHPNNTPWLLVDGNSQVWKRFQYSRTQKGEPITSAFFVGLDFPELKCTDEPIEIEIGKSGRVYTYES